MNRTIHFATIVAVSLLSTSAWADCGTRHFYNNSNLVFELHMTKGTCSFRSQNVRSCAFPPRSVGEIHYDNSTAYDTLRTLMLEPPSEREMITVTGNGGRVYRGNFRVANSCYITHKGRTGKISVNDPADGDIQTCGGNCQ